MERRRTGYVLLGLGAVVAIGGIVYWRSKRSRLGQVMDQHSAGGMKLTHHRDPTMAINKRVGIIQDMVWKSIQDPRMRKVALKITNKCKARDGNCEAKAVFDFVKKNVRYTGDIAPVKMGRNGPEEGIDLFQSAYRTMEFGGGDCDDHSILNATLLALNGISPRLRVTAPRNGQWQHIYAVAGFPKNAPSKWVVLDTTLPRGKYGTEAAYGKAVDFPA